MNNDGNKNADFVTNYKRKDSRIANALILNAMYCVIGLLVLLLIGAISLITYTALSIFVPLKITIFAVIGVMIISFVIGKIVLRQNNPKSDLRK